VNDAVLVRLGERRQHLHADAHGLLFAHRAVGLEVPGEVLPWHVLHGHEERAVVELAGVEDLHGVGVRQLRDDARLLKEARLHALVDSGVGAHHLERGDLAHSNVLDLVDRAHAAFAELLEYAVTTVDDLVALGAREGVGAATDAAQIAATGVAEVGLALEHLGARRAQHRASGANRCREATARSGV